MVFLKSEIFMCAPEDAQTESSAEENPGQSNSADGEYGAGVPVEVSKEQLQERLTQLENDLSSTTKKLNETQDRMLRIAADADNTRKRLEKEKADSRIYTISEFAKDLLPVIDAFDKALLATEKLDQESDVAGEVKAVAEGVQIVSKVFTEALKKHGVEKLPGQGETFNPMFHNAISKVVDPSLKEQVVVEEFIAGYKIGDRVLRTAMVKVGAPD